MRVLSLKKVKIFVFLLLFYITNFAHAECDMGPLLFRDTFLGAAVGAGIGVLLQISNQSTDRIAGNIATSTIVGAGVGGMVGVVELYFSHFGNHRSAWALEKSHFFARPFFAWSPIFRNSPFAVSKEPAFEFSKENFKNMTMGLSLNYTF
jgi:hypothetical protein